MIYFLTIVYSLLFAILSVKNYRVAFGTFVVFLPTYLLRFQLGPLPTTLLEINFLILFFVWLFKYAKQDLPEIFLKIKKNKAIFLALSLFIIGVTISVFIGNNTYQDPTSALIRGLGIWRAYFIEPALMFIILLGRFSEKESRDTISLKTIIYSLIFSCFSVAILSVAQQFTSNLADPSLWDDNFNGRATSFFTSPNAIGLFIAPIIPLMTTMFFRSSRKREKIFLMFFILLSLLAISFSSSEGALVALAGAFLVFTWMMGWKKIAISAVVLGTIFLSVTPKLQQAVFFEDKAGQNRLALWGYTADFLTQSPQNFIFGAGLRKFFHQVQKPNYDPTQIERLGYPHNFFLNFWSETGLLGALSFSAILILALISAYKYKKEDVFLSAGIFSAIVVIIIHGLVDVPYFKNDLSIIFWLIITLAFLPQTKSLSK